MGGGVKLNSSRGYAGYSKCNLKTATWYKGNNLTDLKSSLWPEIEKIFIFETFFSLKTA